MTTVNIYINKNLYCDKEDPILIMPRITKQQGSSGKLTVKENYIFLDRKKRHVKLVVKEFVTPVLPLYADEYSRCGTYSESLDDSYRANQAVLIALAVIKRSLLGGNVNVYLDELACFSGNNTTHINTASLMEFARDEGFTFEIHQEGKTWAKKEPLQDKPVATEPEPLPIAGKLVDNVLYDTDKKVVIVFFKDGTKIVKHCHDEDEFDVNVGVALAIVKRIFGNTTNFRKMVRRKSTKLNAKKPSKKPKAKATKKEGKK